MLIAPFLPPFVWLESVIMSLATELPTECWAHVLSFLHPMEEFFAAKVCSEWCGLLRHQRHQRSMVEWWTTWTRYAVTSVACLQWARENGCPWNADTCAEAARGGHLVVLQWLRANRCEWDEWTCAEA